MLPIDKAKKLLREKIFEPANSSSSVEQKTKDIVKNQEVWLKAFNYVGDLLDYLKRFNAFEKSEIYNDLKSNGISTYEDLYPQLLQEFGYWAQERTRLNDFIVGNEYGSRQILISAKTYETRGSGILPVGTAPNFDYIVIKATLEGGKYPNQWLDKNKDRLKYYFKSINGVTKEKYKENSAILNSQDIQIFVFVRDTATFPFVFEGKYNYQEHHKDQSNNSMWFVLKRHNSHSNISQKFLESQLDLDIEDSLNRTPKEREKRLNHANKKPEKITTTTVAYKRNSDVIVEVLLRANGICEKCLKPAPFNKKKDGSPYLEVHHKVRLADGGEDTVDNAIAVCFNCHRHEHYG